MSDAASEWSSPSREEGEMVRRVVERDTLPATGAFDVGRDRGPGQTVAGSASHSTMLRMVPLSQEGEDSLGQTGLARITR